MDEKTVMRSRKRKRGRRRRNRANSYADEIP